MAKDDGRLLKRRRAVIDIVQVAVANATGRDFDQYFIRPRFRCWHLFNNQRLFGLYEKRGFRLIGKSKGFYTESGEDALVMELRL